MTPDKVQPTLQVLWWAKIRWKCETEIKTVVSGALFRARRLVGLALDSRLNGSASHKSFLTLIVSGYLYVD